MIFLKFKMSSSSLYGREHHYDISSLCGRLFIHYRLSYSKFMHGLKVAGINLNRKVLADLAVNDAAAFAALAEKAKAAV